MIVVKNFYKLLEDLLEFEGYRLLFEGEGKLVGESEKGIRNLIIAGTKMTDRDFENLKRSEGERILVLFEDPGLDIMQKLPKDIKIWGREELIRRFGEMALEKSIFEGATEGTQGLVGPHHPVDLKDYKRKEATLKPVMDFDDVTELGEKMAKGFRYRLELVPHYLYSYKVKMQDGEEDSGQLYINAISGSENFWSFSFERVADIKRSHFKLEPKISQEEGMRRALKAVHNRDRYRQRQEERWEEGGTTIIERGKKVPSKEDIDIYFSEMVYVPMWAVEGTEGIVIINAATGKVEGEPKYIGEEEQRS